MGKLVKVDSGLIVKEENNLDNLLHSFSSEILLFTTKIANTYRLVDQSALQELAVGDVLDFRLGQSKYENNSIEIYSSSKIVGYVPEQDSIIFARLMDAGKKLNAKVKSISPSRSVPLIEIDIFLVDF